MRARAILETVLYASDLAAAEAFYARVFGLEVAQRLDGKFVFFRMAEQMLLIFDPAASSLADPANPIPRHGATGPGHVCFRVDSHSAVDAWRRHLSAQGIEIEADHRWPNGARSIYVRDPAGNSVEVGEARMWGLGS
ncbi:MAG: VOC family protein [Paracoccaceae bacterium]